LTSFIFSAQDYSTRWCYFSSPSGVGCNRKKANEAFIFLALYVSPLDATRFEHKPKLIQHHSIFTFIGMFLEVAALWAHRRQTNVTRQTAVEDKEAGPRQPLDAPAATPAGAV
jgi:hypothetical protein